MNKIKNLSLIIWATTFVCVFALFLGFSLCNNKIDIIDKAEITSKNNYSYGTQISTYIRFKEGYEGKYYLKIELFDNENNLIESEQSSILDMKDLYQYQSESIIVGNDKNIRELSINDLKIKVTAFSYDSTAYKLKIAGYSLFPFVIVSGYFLTYELVKLLKDKKEKQ